MNKKDFVLEIYKDNEYFHAVISGASNSSVRQAAYAKASFISSSYPISHVFISKNELLSKRKHDELFLITAIGVQISK